MRLAELADRNAAASATSRKSRDADADALLAKGADRLSLPRPPRRIECFDIAHIQGTETVAAMVTFVDGVPARSYYRKFKVRSVDNNDFAAMYEVLTRRFKRASKAVEALDPAWAVPDLLVIDGGKGQLGMAVPALQDLGVKMGGEDGIEVIGLAKERDLDAGSAPDRIYRRNVKDSIPLRPNSPELYVLARIRDEAHRFANTFNRDRRTKQSLKSQLDDIPGIGETRRQRLLKHFGSVRAVRTASVDDLATAPGMNKKAAEAIATYFANLEAGGGDGAIDQEIASALGEGVAADESCPHDQRAPDRRRHQRELLVPRRHATRRRLADRRARGRRRARIRPPGRLHGRRRGRCTVATPRRRGAPRRHRDRRGPRLAQRCAEKRHADHGHAARGGGRCGGARPGDGDRRGVVDTARPPARDDRRAR